MPTVALLIRVWVTSLLDVPWTQPVHPHPTPLIRPVFPVHRQVRRKRTPVPAPATPPAGGAGRRPERCRPSSWPRKSNRTAGPVDGIAALLGQRCDLAGPAGPDGPKIGTDPA